MVNVVANNAKADNTLLTQKPNSSKKGMIQGSFHEQDFSTILNKNNQKQTSTVTDTDSAGKNPTTQKMTDVSKKEVAEENTKEELTTATKEQVENKEEVHEEAVCKADASNDEAVISEEVVEVIVQSVAQLLENVAEVLEISAEELQDLMQKIDMEPLDFLKQDSLVALALAAEGEDSLIGIVMNETIYDNLHDLAEIVDGKLDELMQETNLTKEEVDMVLEQLKQELAEYESASAQDEVMLEMSQSIEVKDVTTQDKTVVEVTNQSMDDTQQVFTKVVHTQSNEEQSGQENHSESHSNKGDLEQPNLFLHIQSEMPQVQETEHVFSMTTHDDVTTQNIMRQLVDFVKLETGKEMTQMELQLHPASLGTVNVHLQTKGGIVTASLTTQNEMVKNVIESQVVSLKNNLEEQGIKIDAIEVSVASHQLEKNLEQGKQDRQESRDKKTDGIRKIRRAGINLNAWEEQETDDMEVDELEAVRIAKEMLERNGNTMDLLA